MRFRKEIFDTLAFFTVSANNEVSMTIYRNSFWFTLTRYLIGVAGPEDVRK